MCYTYPVIEFHNYSYLEDGTPRQQQAFATLRRLVIFERLADFNPILAGTIPLGIDRPGSDLDIPCYAADLDGFSALVQACYGDQPGFAIHRKAVRGIDSVIARFDSADFPIEIFAQAVPVEQQNGYRHLVIEHRLLEAGGAPVKEAIRRMKQAGFKTEPAFAGYLGLAGDPYDALLALEPLDDAELYRLVKKRMNCGLCEN